MTTIIFDIIRDEDLIKVVESGLLDDTNLKQIQEKLRSIYKIWDDFEPFYDSLTPQQRWDLECEGKLFPKDWPMQERCMFLAFDPVRYAELYTYLILAKIGFGPIPEDEFPGWDFYNRFDMVAFT